MRSTRTTMTYTERRKEVAKLYLEGWRQVDLAAEFDVNQSTISRDLEAIREDWIEATLADFDEAKARELARIDKLEREYWEQYEASKEPATTIVKESTETQTAKRAKAQKKETSRTGDPRYLSGIQWCIEQRLKIYGVYAAAAVDITSMGEKIGGPVIYLPAVEEDGE